MSEAKKVEELKHHCENHEKCMEMIQAVLDGSASEEDVMHFKSNMDACMPCIENHSLEKSIKEALQEKIEKKCCPEATISSIKASLGFASIVLVFAIVEIKLIQLIF
jgi:hypothetical protein